MLTVGNNSRTIGKVTPNSGGGGIPINQNNKYKELYLGEYSNGIRQQFESLFNRELIVEEDELYMIVVGRRDDLELAQPIKPLVLERFKFKPGKGTYNPIPHTAEFLLFESSSYVAGTDITTIINGANTETFALGDIGTTTLVDFINNNGPYVIDNTDNIYYFLYEQYGVVYLYKFTGELGTYGDGETPINSSELQFVTSSNIQLNIITSGQTLQQTVNNGHKADKVSFESFTQTAFSFGTGFNAYVAAVKVDNLGRYYFGGDFTEYNGNPCNYACRVLPNGDFDPTFAIGTGFNNSITCIEIDQNGKIYFGGWFTQYQGAANVRIIRLNDDGSKDAVFNNATGFNDTVFAMAIASDNDLFVGGQFTQYKGAANVAAIRLNPNGSKRTSFNNTAGFASLFGVPGIRAIKIDESDNIYFGGGFDSYKATPASGIICLEPNGDIFAPFNYGTGVTGSVVMSIDINSKGSIYITAATYNSVNVGGIAKLDASGAIDPEFILDATYNFSNPQKLLIDADDNIFVGLLNYATGEIAKINTHGLLISQFNFGSGFGTGVNTGVSNMAFNDKGNLCVVGGFITYKGQTANRVILLDETTAEALEYTLELQNRLAFLEGKGTYETASAYGAMEDKELINKEILEAKAIYFIPTASTGAVINFERLRIYASSATPLTANITNDLTSAKLGIVQKIYHNHSVAPTFPGGWVRIGGEYKVNQLNIIYAEWSGISRVEYWIAQQFYDNGK